MAVAQVDDDPIAKQFGLTPVTPEEDPVAKRFGLTPVGATPAPHSQAEHDVAEARVRAGETTNPLSDTGRSDIVLPKESPRPQGLPATAEQGIREAPPLPSPQAQAPIYDVDQKTGQLVPRVPYGQLPVLDAGAGASKVAKGVTALATKPPLPSHPIGTPPLTQEEIGGWVPAYYMDAASDVLEGSGQLLTPIAAGMGVVAPAATTLMLAKTYVAQYGTEKAAELMGGSPSARRLAGNVAGAAVALGVGGKQLKDMTADTFMKGLETAKAAGRPLVLAGRLSGFGPGDVPGYRGEPFTQGEGAAPPAKVDTVTPRPEATVEPGTPTAFVSAPPALAGEEEAPPPRGTVRNVPATTEPSRLPPLTPAEQAAANASAKEEAAAEPPTIAGRQVGGTATEDPVAKEFGLTPVERPTMEGSNEPRPAAETAQPAGVAVNAQGANAPAADTGSVTPDRGAERPDTTEVGVQPARQRPARRQGGPQYSLTPAQREAQTLDDLVTAAKTDGYDGDEDTLRTELRDRLELIKEVDDEFARAGRSPQALLQAIAQRGGLSVQKETALQGELKWLREGTKFGTVNGVKGVFKPSGMPVDTMLTSLRQDQQWGHLETHSDLLEAIRGAATAEAPEEAAQTLRNGLGERWWQDIGKATIRPEEALPPDTYEEGDTSFDPADLERQLEDVLDTGETQARLPEAGAVRDQERATPQFEAPFSLTGEVAGPQEREGTLFEQDLADLRSGKERPQFSRVAVPSHSMAKRRGLLEGIERAHGGAVPKRITLKTPLVTRHGVKMTAGEYAKWAWYFDVRDAKETPQFSAAAAPVFYSGLTRAAEGLKQAKGTPEQMLAMLTKSPGVKKEEVDWSGVVPWLRAQTGTVTREAIAEYLRANELHVRETVRGLPMFARRGLATSGDVEQIRQQAREQAQELETAYVDMPSRAIGGVSMPLYDAGARLTPDELTRLLNPAVQRVALAIHHIVRRALAMLPSHETRRVEGVGLLLDADNHGVFWPNGPLARILINPFSWDDGMRSPAAMAKHVVTTIVHEITHLGAQGHGDAFAWEYALNLRHFGAKFIADAERQLTEAYADPKQPAIVSRPIDAALSLYAVSRGRPGTAPDALSRAGGYAERSANERNEPGAAPERPGQNRSRTVTRAELASLAAKRGTSPRIEAARAAQAGYSLAREATDLQATVLPGAKELGEYVVEPAVKAVSAAVKKDSALFRVILDPAHVSRSAEAGAGILRAHNAAKDQQVTRVRRQFEAVKRMMDGWSHDQSLSFWDVMQGSAATDTLSPDLQPIAAAFRGALNHWTQAVTSRGLIRQYLEHYWPQEWQRGGTPIEQIVRRLFSRRPLAGPESYRKRRTIPTTRQGIEEFGKTPVSWNPAEQLDRKITEMAKSVAAFDIRRDFQKQGLRKFVPAGKRAPEGWVPDSDRGPVYGPQQVTVQPQGIVGTVTGRPTFGRLVAGHYYLQPDVARLLHNYLSPGLAGKSALFDAYRFMGNSTSQVLLGWSTYHLWMTALESIISKQSLAAELFSRGAYGKAMRIQLQVGPHGVIRDLVRGYRAMQTFYSDAANANEITGIMGQVVNAGGGFGWSLLEHADAPKKFMADMRGLYGALKRLEGAGALQKAGAGAVHGAVGTVELPTKLIMEHWVPYLKLAAFLDLARAELERIGPDASLAEQRRVLGEAWDAVDDRFGQLRYDNLFWDNSFKQVLTSAFLSVGWNVGTIRHGLGAPGSQIGRMMENRARRAAGEAPEPWLHRRMAWLLVGAIIVGMIGAIYHYLHTGKRPASMKDYFAPEDGGTDTAGHTTRSMLISYAKDLYGWTHHPVTTLGNKVKPFLSMLLEAWRNEDFYKTELRNPDDPALVQLGQVLEHWLGEMRPIGWQKAVTRAGPNASTAAKLKEWAEEQATPFTPAPAEFGRSPAEQYLRDMSPPEHRTMAQAQHQDAARSLRAAIKAGDAEGIRTASAELGSRSIKANIQATRRTALQNAFRSATLDQAMHAYELAEPDERRILRPDLARKWHNQFPQVPPLQRAAMATRFQAVASLPIAAGGAH